MGIVYTAHSHTLIKYSVIYWCTSTATHTVFFIQKRIIRIKLGIGQRSSWRNGFKELDILTVPSLYFFFNDGICQIVKLSSQLSGQLLNTLYTHQV